MKFICPSCSENFEVDKKHFLLCPFCDKPIIEEKIYNEIRDKVENSNYSEEEMSKILEEEEKIYNKIKGSALEKSKEYLEAMFKMLKDPKAEVVNKVTSLASLVYVVNPMDIIPDFIPIVGYLDDFGAVMIAVGMIGKALENYYSNMNENKTRKNDDTILYKITAEAQTNIATVSIKKNIITWYIPNSKRNNLNVSLITNKLMNNNEIYVLTQNVVDFLVPIKDFDQYIIDNVFNEATTILKALGVKSIKYKKKLATTSDKKIAGKVQYQSIFDLESNGNIKGINVQTDEATSCFEKVDLVECLSNDKFIDRLIWYFTDNSILDERVFVERFEKGLLNTTITRSLELNSVLDVESRVSIKKYGDLSSGISVSEAAKVQWTIDVEYYSLSDIDKIELRNIYENLKIKLEERKQKLSVS